MLEAKEVVKSFDGFRALDSATLTVPKGTVYGLVGPNGAGKSTIIRHFTGVYRPDSGQLLLEGAPIWENTDAKRRMVVFPLNDRQMLRRMSKGMQKQAAFWLTMCCMPEYLILDEPVDGLDPVMRRQVWSLLLGDVAERGTTVLVSSHNLRELEDVCDHVGIMNQGKVLLERSLSELQDTTVKLQVVYPGEEPRLPAELHILHHSAVGRVHTYILRGDRESILNRMQITAPLLLEAIPLTLEEIFIYELGGADYAVRDIVL